jgi:predicted dehydrogenase
MRYYPLIRQAKEFIPHPQVLVAQMMDERWRDDAWAQDPVQGGANVHAQGCHTTEILRFLAGSEAEMLWAAGGSFTHPGHPCIDHCVASIKFRSGAVASWIQGDTALPPYVSKFFIEMFGDGKSVQLYDRLKKATFFDGEKSWTLERDEEEGFMLENQEFVRALLEKRQPEICVTDGLQATRIVLAADRAIRTGEVQHL